MADWGLRSDEQKKEDNRKNQEEIERQRQKQRVKVANKIAHGMKKANHKKIANFLLYCLKYNAKEADKNGKSSATYDCLLYEIKQYDYTVDSPFTLLPYRLLYHVYRDIFYKGLIAKGIYTQYFSSKLYNCNDKVRAEAFATMAELLPKELRLHIDKVFSNTSAQNAEITFTSKGLRLEIAIQLNW